MSETLSLQIKADPTGPDAPVVNKPAADPNRPAWLPEKFKTPEEFAASYTALETKLGTTAPDATALEALKTAGLDFKQLSEEYLANDGKLTAASMSALTAKGLTADQVDQFIKGQEATARENTRDVHAAVGGKDRFDKLQTYASTAFTAAEIAAYNTAAGKGDYVTVKMLLSGLNTKFEAEFGKDGNLTKGTTPVVNADVFENFQAYRNVLKDPRYKTDTNFRVAVDAKLERSTFYKPNK